MTSSGAARRRAIRDLILERPISSQSELVELLADRGHPVTQATVSRDLQLIGAVKSDEDEYQLVDHVPLEESIEQLSRSLGEFVDSIRPSGNLVVLHTPPGAAQVVAAAIDTARLDGVLGTVAGDDTILVVAAEHATGRGIAHKLEEIGGTE